MAYEAYRDDDRDFETARADANNANTIRNAADVAIATKSTAFAPTSPPPRYKTAPFATALVVFFAFS